MNKKSIAFKTLGCKLNFSESSGISRDFHNNSFQSVDFNNKADIYVINTCTVTANAEKKCRTAIRQAAKRNPEAQIAVVGCFSELKSREIAEIEGVDLILGTNEKFNLYQYITDTKNNSKEKIFIGGIQTEKSFIPSYSSGDRTRSFLKIQDGCDYFCSYCTIPFARGRSRSDSIENTVKLAQEIAQSKIKEIILTGVNIGEFGKSNKESFFDLIKALDKVTGIERFRISSIEPDLLSDEIIDFVAESNKFLPHFHIPLQSGSNKILSAMKRKYKREDFAERIRKIREVIPLCMVAVDVIVGFPGESDDDFNTTFKFLENTNISYIHVFSYSERKNTRSAELTDKVHPKIIQGRSKLLHQLSDKKKYSFYQLNKSLKTNVLFESDRKGEEMFGFTENYIKVRTAYNPKLINQINMVELIDIEDDGIYRIAL
ncbi:tRNA (N(6)-L-threonylcarbamoyladenosine(37)-C(2))-methylthiotransferase MtaB [Bacteroidota bacterium]